MATYELTDLNGETWSFDRSGALSLQYVRGLEGAPFELDTTHGVDQPGVTVIATDLKPGVIELGVNVEPGYSGERAVDVLSELVDGLGDGLPRAGKLMRFKVIDTGRFQEVRLAERFTVDWEKMRWAGFNFLDGVKLMSDESWWRTNPFDKTFAPADFATAKVKNLGDEPAWWWAKITGPITAPTLGVAGEAIPLPTVPAGDTLTIETDPNWWAITDAAGVDKSWIGTRWHQRVPARTHKTTPAGQPFTITGTGTTAATNVRIVVPQLFRRAL